MGRLISSTLISLDGYAADVDGGFSWALPDEAVHAAANDLQRGIGTMLLGRRMYEVLAAWEDWDTSDEPPVVAEFAELWRGTDKIVYSTTLDEPITARTRIERAFDPDQVRGWLADSPRDLAIGGPTLTTVAARAGLVDDWHSFVFPVLVGGGLSGWPPDVVETLELVSVQRFDSGVVHLHHRRAAGS